MPVTRGEKLDSYSSLIVEISPTTRPVNDHGSHVAGIIGAKKVDTPAGAGVSFAGMCLDINLYDSRVISEDLESMEFGVIGAFEFIRYLNAWSGNLASCDVGLPGRPARPALSKEPCCHGGEGLPHTPARFVTLNFILPV
jgi:serine protease AprX